MRKFIKTLGIESFFDGRKQTRKEPPPFEMHENDIKIMKQLQIDLFLTIEEINAQIFPDLPVSLIEEGVERLREAGYLGRVKRDKKNAYFLDDKGDEFLIS